MKKAVCISCSDHYDHRLHVAADCLRARGYATTYITSDFDHTRKEPFTCSVEGCVQIPARPYKKNLSLDRILSHRNFARDVFRYLENQPQQPDVLVILLPPNFLTHYGAKYKKRHPEVKLIFDIFDLWPETFPSSSTKRLLAPVFRVWAALRDRNLDKADFVVTECEMFRKILRLPKKTSKTVWLSADPLQAESSQPQLRTDALELCYLGAINNIISIPDICNLIKELTAKKPVILHIIGKGERQEEFVEEATNSGAEVIFHGAVYDENKKLEIMNRCHFGLNIMKASVCVGLTMKSVDYFRYGLPVINNIPADTQALVEKQGVGVQLIEGCSDTLLSLTNEACLNMRTCVKRVFAESFEHSVIYGQYAQILNRILGE